MYLASKKEAMRGGRGSKTPMDTFHHRQLSCDVIGVLQGQKDFLNFSNNSQEVTNVSFTLAQLLLQLLAELLLHNIVLLMEMSFDDFLKMFSSSVQNKT